VSGRERGSIKKATHFEFHTIISMHIYLKIMSSNLTIDIYISSKAISWAMYTVDKTYGEEHE